MDNFNLLKRIIDDGIPNNIIITELGKNKLQAACLYALDGGKRLRPVIIHCIVHALRRSRELPINIITDASLAIEFIHTASLLIDDLPCMDNDTMRRGKPCLHITMGEMVTQLTSITLVTGAFRTMCKALAKLAETDYMDKNQCNEIGMILCDLISHNVGALGAAGGQFLDVAIAKGDYFELDDFGTHAKNIVHKEMVTDIIHKKTSSFFEIAFVTGWLIGKGSINKLTVIKDLSKLFGFTFQVSDDFEDYYQDLRTNKKNISQNYVINFGADKAYDDYNDTIKGLSILLNKLGINNIVFDEIINYMTVKVDKYYHMLKNK